MNKTTTTPEEDLKTLHADIVELINKAADAEATEFKGDDKSVYYRDCISRQTVSLFAGDGKVVKFEVWSGSAIICVDDHKKGSRTRLVIHEGGEAKFTSDCLPFHHIPFEMFMSEINEAKRIMDV